MIYSTYLYQGNAKSSTLEVLIYSNIQHTYLHAMLYSPICRIYFGPKPFLFITDLDMVQDVMVKKFDKFVDRVVRTCSGMWFHTDMLSVIIHVLPCSVVCPYVQ